MAILYAKQKNFLDFSSGIRQEHLDSVYVFNASLDTLYQTAPWIINNETKKKCWLPHCTTESSESAKFRCTRCATALYCGKEHQTSNWMHHKQLCSQMLVLARLIKVLQLPFNGFYDFHFNLEYHSDEESEMMRDSAIDEFLIKHGDYSSKPLQKRALEKLLAHIVAKPDWIKSAADITGVEYETIRRFVSQNFIDTVAGKALLEACSRLGSGASNAIIDSNETDELMNTSLLFLPFWAAQILPDMAINWFIQEETHYVESLYVTGGWGKVNTELLFSHSNGSSVVFNDSCSLLCNLSIDISFCKRFTGLKVRILIPIPGHAIDDGDLGDRVAIRTSLINPPKELTSSVTIWVRIDSILEGFKREKSPYGNAGENEAQAMFEALTTLSKISLPERLIGRMIGKG